MGLEEVINLRIKNLDVYGDSALIINQIKGEWDTRHPGLIPYKDYARRLLPFFNKVKFHHIPINLFLFAILHDNKQQVSFFEQLVLPCTSRRNFFAISSLSGQLAVHCQFTPVDGKTFKFTEIARCEIFASGGLFI